MSSSSDQQCRGPGENLYCQNLTCWLVEVYQVWQIATTTGSFCLGAASLTWRKGEKHLGWEQAHQQTPKFSGSQLILRSTFRCYHIMVSAKSDNTITIHYLMHCLLVWAPKYRVSRTAMYHPIGWSIHWRQAGILFSGNSNSPCKATVNGREKHTQIVWPAPVRFFFFFLMWKKIMTSPWNHLCNYFFSSIKSLCKE